MNADSPPPPPSITPPDAARVSWRLPGPLRRTARAFAEALFADDAGPPPPDRLDWLLDDVEDFLGRSGGRAQGVFQASMLALATLAPLAVGRPLPLWALDWETRVKAVERFEQTPLGLAVLGAKAMLCIVWYEHPAAQAEIGYDRGCLGPAGTEDAAGAKGAR